MSGGIPVTARLKNKPNNADSVASKVLRPPSIGMRGNLPRQAMNQVTTASIEASMMPGTMPAMNSAPIEVLVETPYSTRMIDGGTRMPSAPDVEITPTPNRRG